jgi:hypothetical protein
MMTMIHQPEITPLTSYWKKAKPKWKQVAFWVVATLIDLGGGDADYDPCIGL